MKTIYEKQIELVSELEELYDRAAEIQDALAEQGIDLDEYFTVSEDAEEMDEGIANMSKTKQLIARRKAARRKKLNPTYAQTNNSRRAKSVAQIRRMKK